MTGKLISQLVPSMANQWSHPHGKTSPKVVPSRWQTTPTSQAPTLPIRWWFAAISGPRRVAGSGW
jgi:hypothetical protein